MPNYRALAHEAAVRHVEECLEAKALRDADEEPLHDPATAKFCGCPECVIREALHAARPYLFWSSNSPDEPVPPIPQDLQDALMRRDE